MNKKKWDALPPDVQKIVEKVDEEWIDKTGVLWDTTDQDGIKFITDRGVKLISQSKEEEARWAAAVRPLLDVYVAAMKKQNLPGEETLKFSLDYIKANQKAK